MERPHPWLRLRLPTAIDIERGRVAVEPRTDPLGRFRQRSAAVGRVELDPGSLG